MRSLSRRLAAAALLVLPAAAGAQGTLSTQGFGYPTGQMSTRTLGTGGSLAEIDPLSVTNPATLINLGASALYFQAEPEYRTIRVGGSSDRSTIARYPLVAAGVPLTPTLFAGLSVSNLLDRSFETVARGSQVVGGTTVNSTNTFKSDGAIGDLRLALSWAPRPWLHLGLAGHAISGDNRLTSSQEFDSTAYQGILDTVTVTYVGNAFSGGVEVYTGRYAVVAASYRRGGPLSLKHGDSTLSSARVPDRLALSAAYLGIRGTSIAVRSAKEQWTDLRGLGSAGLPISDGWDTSVGADVLGPRFAGRSVQLRAGARWRTLPFDARPTLATGGFGPSAKVSEKSYSFGAGTLLARGRAALDLAAIRATRSSAATSVEENAWTLSFGVTVRP
ncbi:MAG TPA: hypothetical protein VFI52_18055 [Gemmatimonadaceae bacterium]|nr:hypothetical protein [Gemmatimonadaceae bacterium]